MNRVVAVVVTYNRFQLLTRVVESLRRQTIEINHIVVVNNGSVDGTQEWLDIQEDLCVIHQDNVGGAGGFARGIQEAQMIGCDWIWCMDDDVFPHATCLEEMLKRGEGKDIGILCPHRIMSDRTFTSESKVVNLSNPFRNTFSFPLTPRDVEDNDIVEIEGMAFEGPLIKMEVANKIGLPNKDFFILYDDTDYSYRAVLAGYKVAIVRDALMDKYNFVSNSSTHDGKNKDKWKIAYHIRNTAYFCHKYGKNVFVRYFGAFPFLLHMYAAITFNFFIGHKYKFSDYSHYWRMMRRGVNGELGKM